MTTNEFVVGGGVVTSVSRPSIDQLARDAIEDLGLLPEWGDLVNPDDGSRGRRLARRPFIIKRAVRSLGAS